MTSRRTAISLAGAALLVTYFAAANMPSQDADRTGDRAPLADTSSTQTLADEVRSQATRLHSRMAQAPEPQDNPRNPFSFAGTRVARGASPDVRAAVVEEAPAAFVPPAPALTLMGIAEEAIVGGIRRTAVIGGDGDAIFMVTEGEPVGDRYKVTRIGADAVELEDLVTKAYRRIALR
jgi:hypothetical protein